MTRAWVVADHHFGHRNIIKYCDRPWTDENKMDEDLIKLHNSVVAPDDVVYFLGDMTMKQSDRVGWLQKIVGRMHGTKHLIFGNHDNWHWNKYLDVGFQTCHTFLELGLGSTQYMADLNHPYLGVRLCHDPAWAQDKNYLWICGHIHNNTIADNHIAIVSVEHTAYKPVPLTDIMAGLRP
jgi:calcineurin-like phosphoesterase family protein